MVAHDPQRTSYAPENNANIQGAPVIHKWVREIPFPDYIPQRGQLLTVQFRANGELINDGIILVPTSGGVYALDPKTGSVLWKYSTDMALGESPAVVDMVMYVPVLDKTIHAVNISKSGATLKWKTAKAGNGYYASPLVANGKVYIGNRDGYFYAFNTTDGSLAWHYPGIDGKPRDRFYSQSAAISPDNSTVYAATSDSYVIALDAQTGAERAKSIKFPGDGFHVYWPVYYKGDPNNPNDDGVAVARASNYPVQDHGIDSVTLSAKVGQNQERLLYLKRDICISYFPNPEACPVTNPTSPQSLSTTRFEQWHQEVPDMEYQYFLNPSTLTKKSIVPTIWWGNNGRDNMPPPVVGSIGKLYYLSSWFDGGSDLYFPQGRYMEWKPGERVFRPLPDATINTQSHDQPETLSFFHDSLFASGTYHWGFTNPTILNPWDGSRGFDKANAIVPRFPNFGANFQEYGYGFSPRTASGEHNAEYLTTHGIQSPLVPLKENVFFHKMNTAIMMCFDRNQDNQCDSEI